jgi:hypothetical protein
MPSKPKISAKKKVPPVAAAATCSPCAECGMLTSPEDYHPYGACLMFKACHNGAVVRANLWAIQERSYDIGRRSGENCKPSMEANHGQANAQAMASPPLTPQDQPHE